MDEKISKTNHIKLCTIFTVLDIELRVKNLLFSDGSMNQCVFHIFVIAE